MQQRSALRQVQLALRITIAIAALAMAGCGDGKNLPKVYLVKGSVLVNGQPASDVQVVLNRTSTDKLSVPTTPQAVTDAKGEFLITSYNSDDGAPEGDYVVTFEWRERTGLTKQDLDGPDRLGGAYAKAEKNKDIPGFVVKVEKKPVELPPFKLTQSAAAKARAEAGKKGGMNFQGPLK